MLDFIKNKFGRSNMKEVITDYLSVPKSVQDVIEVDKIFDDGIFLCDKNIYSKTYKFSDINYITASSQEKENDFDKYCSILESLEDDVSTQITIINRKIKTEELDRVTMRENKEDGKDEYRKEINEMIRGIANGENAIIQDKYITLTVKTDSYEHAKDYFNLIGANLCERFNELGSSAKELSLTERLRIIHNFCRPEENSDYYFDLRDTKMKGQSFKDYVSPDGFEFNSDYFKVGDKFARVLFIRDYPTYIKDSIVWALTDTNRNIIFNFDIIPIPSEKAKRFGEKQALGIETNIANYQRRQNANDNYTSILPYDLENQRAAVREFLEKINGDNQKVFKVIMTIMHTADSLEELNNDTKAISATARRYMCQIAPLRYQQLEGFNATLPFGINKLSARRTLITESLAVFMPFKIQEIQHEGGVFQGVNTISKNMIVVNRSALINGNCFILGVSGSGKSFTAKEEIINLLLSTDSDVIIIDPEREYKALVEAMEGQVIKLSPTSKNHINCLDVNEEYSLYDLDKTDKENLNEKEVRENKEKAIIATKTDFLMSVIEELMGDKIEADRGRPIVDRCLSHVYQPYFNRKFKGKLPTLLEFYEDMKKQPEEMAQDYALSLELFASGSHNTFAKQTNVDINNRLICYDILELGNQLTAIGMLVVLDSILNRITQNKAKGRNTYIFMDEIYLLFQHKYTAEFLSSLWKRVRKYGAFCTGITQNVDDLLQSHTARTMLANSEFIIMLKQGGTDRENLAELLEISNSQLKHITNVEVGHGLVKVGDALVPFERKFPKNTELYRMMSTKMGE